MPRLPLVEKFFIVPFCLCQLQYSSPVLKVRRCRDHSHKSPIISLPLQSFSHLYCSTCSAVTKVGDDFLLPKPIRLFLFLPWLSISAYGLCQHVMIYSGTCHPWRTLYICQTSFSLSRTWTISDISLYCATFLPLQLNIMYWDCPMSVTRNYLIIFDCCVLFQDGYTYLIMPLLMDMFFDCKQCCFCPLI